MTFFVPKMGQKSVFSEKKTILLNCLYTSMLFKPMLCLHMYCSNQLLLVVLKIRTFSMFLSLFQALQTCFRVTNRRFWKIGEISIFGCFCPISQKVFISYEQLQRTTPHKSHMIFQFNLSKMTLTSFLRSQRSNGQN